MTLLQKFTIGVAFVVLVSAGVLYLLGRGELDDESFVRSRPPGLQEESALRSVRLYFADPATYSLVPEQRTIPAGHGLTAQLEAAVRELSAGSLEDNAPSIPPGTRLQRAFVDPWGLAFLDFSPELLQAGQAGDGPEWLAVAALVRTITDNFPEIREVRFMLDGDVITSLGGYMDLEEPLGPEDFPLQATVR